MAADAAPWPALTGARRLRFLTVFALYMAQGAPEGLLYVAVPAWLAARGATAEQIGRYIGIILLPWSFKLVGGLLMDRFTFLAMGRRRPWLLGAQVVLAGSLLAYGSGAADALGRLTTFGFLVNVAAAFQDVAIDGMAVDVIPEAERARANGLMWGGKTLGIAGSAFLSGQLLARGALASASAAIASFVLLVMTLPLLLRERPGERLLPWSAGAASPPATAEQVHGWLPLARTLFAALRTRRSVAFGGAVFVALAGYGLHTSMVPVLGVKGLGWSQGSYTRLAGSADLAGGVFGLLVAGPLAERFGAKRTLLGALLLLAALHGALLASAEAWGRPWVFAGYMVLYQLLFVQLSVALYSVAMGLSLPRVAATQFSVYMGLVNLGTSAGAALLGRVRSAAGYPAVMAAIAAACVVAAALLWLSRPPRAPAARPS